MAARRLLILNTPDGALDALCKTFEATTPGPYETERVVSAAMLLERLTAGLPWDLVVVDHALGDGTESGFALLPRIREARPEVPVVMVAEKGDVATVASAIKAGANDFLVRTGKLTDRVRTLLEKLEPQFDLISRNRMLCEQNMLLQEAAEQEFQILGESPQIMEVVERIDRVARIPRPVLITGERGTGKELVARAVHSAAGDASRPMVVVNCAAFPDNLLETELFGHEKGAFTGAVGQTHGKFEVASGGTLFLDEIGNMSISFQQKILRVVEYGTFTRVGGSVEIHVAARIIAATNMDLKKRMDAGTFLRDLYDRLAFEIIHMPPLREREGDIELLSRYFLNRFMREIPSLRGKRLSQAALKVLKEHPLPGNVRELKNIIERAAYRDTTNEITPVDLGIMFEDKPGVEGHSFHEKVEAFKTGLIRSALAAAGGNQAKAARALDLSYHQYRYFVKKYRVLSTIMRETSECS